VSKPLKVAIFNASDDTVEMLSVILQHAGFVTENAHVSDVKRGVTDFVAFIEDHDPAAVVWDISPPYQENWNFFQLLRTSRVLDGRGVVVTTTHKLHLDKIAGFDSGAIEIVGKPYDLDQVVTAVQSGIKSAAERRR
jgi:DNA-binding response OmpR family regulator